MVVTKAGNDGYVTLVEMRRRLRLVWPSPRELLEHEGLSDEIRRVDGVEAVPVSVVEKLVSEIVPGATFGPIREGWSA